PEWPIFFIPPDADLQKYGNVPRQCFDYCKKRTLRLLRLFAPRDEPGPAVRFFLKEEWGLLVFAGPGFEIIISRITHRLNQPRRFRKPAEDVHALHRLSTRAFHQIILRAHHDESAR